MPQLNDISNLVHDLGGKIMFDTAVVVKDAPHHDPFRCWGIWADEKVYLMDADQNWHELKETDSNAELVINSLYQRLKIYATDKKSERLFGMATVDR